MILIGEKINSNIPSVYNAMMYGNKDYIKSFISLQAKNGADYLLVNASLCMNKEFEQMHWISAEITNNTKCGLFLESYDMRIIKKALSLFRGNRIIIGNVTYDDERLNYLIPLLAQYGSGVVISPSYTDGQVPFSANERVELLSEMCERLVKLGISESDVYADVLALPVLQDENNGIKAIKTLSLIKKYISGVKTICNISNVSYGLPKRENLNSAFLSLLSVGGLDVAVCDVLNENIHLSVKASDVLCGRDKGCAEYICNFKSEE